MSAIVADTHALLWFVFGSAKLSKAARAALVNAETNGKLIYVPSICIVEMRYLIEKGTIAESDYQTILAKMNSPISALTVAALDSVTADALAQIPRSLVPDMPDRIVAATAFVLALPLATRDANIQKLTNISIVW